MAALATIVLVRTRAQGAKSLVSRVRLAAALDRAISEVALLREEMRLKDARLARLDARKRPQAGGATPDPRASRGARLVAG